MSQALRPFVINADDLLFILDQATFPTLKAHTTLSNGTVVFGYQDPTGKWHDVAYQANGAGPVLNLDATKVTYGDSLNNAILSINLVGYLATTFDPTTVVYHGPNVTLYDAPGSLPLLLTDGQFLYNGPRDFAGLRDINGYFNNLEAAHTAWGATKSSFLGLVPADYGNYVQEVFGPADPDRTIHVDKVNVTNESAHVTGPVNVGPFIFNGTSWTADQTTTHDTKTIHDGHHQTANSISIQTSTEVQTGVNFLEIGGQISTNGGTVVVTDSISTSYSGGELDTTANSLAFDSTSGDWYYAGAGNGTKAAHNFHGVTNGVLAPADYSDPLASVVDYTPRMISQLVASSTSPTLADSAMSRAMDPADLQTFTYDFVDPVTGAVTEHNHVETTVLNINSVAADPRLSGWFVLFGQFFDHGLDFLAKPGNGPTIQIALAVDDPLYGVIGPDGQPTTSITINRATPDAGTGVGGIPATYTNNTSPYIDQSQTYGSNDQIDMLLRKWVQDPNTGLYHAGSELLDGFTLKTAYISNTFDDAGKVGGHLNADAAGAQTVMTTTRTLPTLAELRAALLATGRDDLTWEDVTGNYRMRDVQGHVRTDFTGTGANADGTMGSGEPIILDNNPSMDATHLTGFATANFTYEAYSAGQAGVQHATGQTIQQILNASIAGIGTLDIASDMAHAGQLHLHVNSGPGAGDYYGLAAMAPWLDFSTNSIASTLFNGTAGPMPALTADQHAAVGELMMESLSSFYVAGDGRANENFGLTTIHHVFHEDHNVQRINLMTSVYEQSTVDDLHKWQVAVASSHGTAGANVQVTAGHFEAKANTVLALIQGGAHDGEILAVSGANDPLIANSNSYLLTDSDGNTISAAGSYTDANGYVSWNEDTIFNSTKLMVEMEYQHVAIDQYARLITPDLPEFVTYDATIQADISTEYAQAAFRFGHSQLRDSIDALDPSNVVTGNILHYALEASFLNPAAFASVGPAALVEGMTHQAMNETDEFVTPALQQTLLGQPLDLAAINIARGRDLGIPTLNETRKALYDALIAERAAGGTGTQIHSKLQLDQLTPYNSWSDFEGSIAHKGSIVNFIAAYSFDGDLAKSQLLYDLSHNDQALIPLTADELALQGQLGWTKTDAINFMSNNGSTIAGADGYNAIDLWIGGLAESHVIGGQLGYTFNAIFEDQMERLMDGDRFYYLYRLFGALPSNLNLNDSVTLQQFKDIIERTTGTEYLGGDVMTYADSSVSMFLRPTGTDPTQLVTLSGIGNDGLTHNATGIAIDGHDHKYGALAEELHMGIYSDGGASDAANGKVLHHISDADKYYGTDGVHFNSISGDYIYDARPTDPNTNSNGNPEYGAAAHETIVGTAFNDYIDAGDGDDTVYGGAGNDILIGNGGGDHVYGGDGNDLIYGGGGKNGADVADFLDGGNGDDVVYGGQNNGVTEIVMGGDGNDFLYGESGIDEVHGQRGDDYVDGGNDTDVLFGDEGNDYMFGGEGPDTMYGGSGDDIIDGGSGTDVQAGETGDDILFASQGGGVAQGDADELIGGDTNGNDNGFDLASFQIVDQALNVAADLNNQQLNGVTTGVPFLPFGEMWMGIDGIVGSKFSDQFVPGTIGINLAPTTENPRGNQFGAGIIGDDNDNWLVGGSGSDRVQAEGGNDVVVGGSIRLDALIGKYTVNGVAASYNTEVDGASHRVDPNAILTGGILDAVNGFLGGSPTFAKHFTEMLQSEARKDVVLGDDVSNTSKGTDTAVFTGDHTQYTLQAIDINGHLLGTVNGGVLTAVPGADFTTMVAVLVTDHLASRTAADGITTIPGDGKDVLIQIDQVQFSDQLINLRAYFDAPPALDLNYVPVAAPVATDNFNGNQAGYNKGTGWAGNWIETGDNGSANNGRILNTTGFNGGALQINGVNTNGTAATVGISRAVDLHGNPAGAKVDFDYTVNRLDAGKSLLVQAWNATTSHWDTVGSINGSGTGNGASSVNNGHMSVNLTADEASISSKIQFVTSGNWNQGATGNFNIGNADRVTIDNVVVTAASGGVTDSALGTGNTINYTERAAAVAIASAPRITDPDGTTIASANIHIRDGKAGDILTVLNAATLQGLGITATGAGTNTIQLSGVATWAAYQAALDLIGFSDPTDHNPGSADRHIDVTVNDGFKDSNVATTTVHFTPVDDLATLNPDTVVTNFGNNNSFTVRDALFLANDSDVDSTLGIGGTGNQNSLSANHSDQNSSISITDTGGTLGGSFSYSGSGSNSGVSATVTLVEQSAAGNLTATNGSGQILADNNSAHTIIGGAGNDFLIGNGGVDTMTGGAGSDTFVFNLTGDTGNVNATLTAANITALDHITDFTQGSDKIDLSAIDANTSQGGAQAFQWDGVESGNNHNHTRGHVGYYLTTISGVTHTIIEGNTSLGNTGGHDFQIDLTTAVNLVQTDFVL